MKSESSVLSDRSRATSLLIIAIICIAGVLSLGAFVYSGYVSTNVKNSAVQSIHTSAEIQASDAANVLSSKFQLVSANLFLIANTQAVTAHNTTIAQRLLDLAQNSSRLYTRYYNWIGGDGTLLGSSNQTLLTLSTRYDVNYSTSDYFVGAMQTGLTYVSNATVESLYHNVTVVVSVPIYVTRLVDGQTRRTFDGVVASSVLVSSLGAPLQSELPPQLKSTVGLIGADGIVLYSTGMNATGLGVYSAQYQDLLQSGLQSQFDSFLHTSLEGKAGVQDLSYKGASGTIAYHPVFIQTTLDNSTAPEFFGVSYVSAANVLEAGQALQITQLQSFTELTILGIESSAVIAVIVVIRWNRALDMTVSKRTNDLAERTDELARANQELALREENQRDFINIAAHELRTPVQPILGLTDMMQQDMIEQSGRKGTVEVSEKEVKMLERNAKRLEDLTRNILDVTRIDSGTFNLSRTRFDLNEKAREVIEEMTGVLSSDAAASSAKVVFAPIQERLPVDADGTRVFEVIANLLKNALVFSGEHKVEVSTRREGSSAVLRVRDYGSGISAEVQPKLFTKFASNSPNGLGLGLFISKKIVEAHGGRIWAENNKDGGGASFYFSIPLVPPDKTSDSNLTGEERVKGGPPEVGKQ